MHQYELMRLLARVADVLADVATGNHAGVQALELRAEIAKLAAEWSAEENEYVAAVTTHDHEEIGQWLTRVSDEWKSDG